MKRGIYSILLLAVVLSGCARSRPEAAAQPVTLEKAAADKLINEMGKQRAEEEEWLRSSPTSYFAAVDRIDFDQKNVLTVGRAADNDVRLDDLLVEPHHLRVSVDGDRFRVECIDAKARFTIKDITKREATVDPSTIQVGRFMLRLSHQRFPALIVFDPKNLQREHHKKLNYFPIDLSYRYELPLNRFPKAEETIIMSTRGTQRKAARIGWVDFLVGRTPCRLEALRLLEPGSGQDNISIFFKDATSGKETYPLGRYVDLKKLDSGLYLLDFNLAYNPACAFSEYYSCPVPPKENMLKVAIRAGERAPIVLQPVDPNMDRGRAAMPSH